MPYLMSDFKKKNGYKRSTELSAGTAFTGRTTAAAYFPGKPGEERTGTPEQKAGGGGLKKLVEKLTAKWPINLTSMGDCNKILVGRYAFLRLPNEYKIY